MKKLELHIPIAEDGQSIVELIEATLSAQSNSLTKTQIKHAIVQGALWLTTGKHTKRLRRIKKTLNSGQTLHFYFNEKVLSQAVPSAKLLLDKQSYSIWYKPYGMLSQGSKWSDHTTITRFAEKQLNRPAFIVHRLDRAASGIIVVAHSKKAAQALTKMFELHNLTKIYRIICHGKFTKQQLEVDLNVDNKTALSIFSALAYEEDKDLSHIEVEIKTGRKHQIRIHAASLGLPVFGDRLHGDKSKTYRNTDNLALCAVKLSFNCPLTGENIEVELPAELTPSLATI